MSAAPAAEEGVWPVWGACHTTASTRTCRMQESAASSGCKHAAFAWPTPCSPSRGSTAQPQARSRSCEDSPDSLTRGEGQQVRAQVLSGQSGLPGLCTSATNTIKLMIGNSQSVNCCFQLHLSRIFTGVADPYMGSFIRTNEGVFTFGSAGSMSSTILQTLAGTMSCADMHAPAALPGITYPFFAQLDTALRRLLQRMDSAPVPLPSPACSDAKQSSCQAQQPVARRSSGVCAEQWAHTPPPRAASSQWQELRDNPAYEQLALGPTLLQQPPQPAWTRSHRLSHFPLPLKHGMGDICRPWAPVAQQPAPHLRHQSQQSPCVSQAAMSDSHGYRPALRPQLHGKWPDELPVRLASDCPTSVTEKSNPLFAVASGAHPHTLPQHHCVSSHPISRSGLPQSLQQQSHHNRPSPPADASPVAAQTLQHQKLHRRLERQLRQLHDQQVNDGGIAHPGAGHHHRQGAWQANVGSPVSKPIVQQEAVIVDRQQAADDGAQGVPPPA